MKKEDYRFTYLVLAFYIFFGFLFSAFIFNSTLSLIIFNIITLSFILFYNKRGKDLILLLTILTVVFSLSIKKILFDYSDDNENLQNLIIGDSDSLLYHQIAMQIAKNIPFLDQIKLWDLSYLQTVQEDNGVIFNNLGHYWLLGIIYTSIGDNAVEWFLVINILAVSFSIYFLAKLTINKIKLNYNFLMYFSLVFIYLSNDIVISIIFSLRKDLIIVVLMTITIYLTINSKNKKTLFYLLLLSVFLIIIYNYRKEYALIIIFFLISKKVIMSSLANKLLSTKKVVLMFIAMILVAPLWSHWLFSTRVNTEIHNYDQYQNFLFGGSSILINNWWLNWLYVLLTPLPTLKLELSLDIFNGWISFLSNIILLYIFIKSVLSKQYHIDQYIVFVFILYLLYAVLVALGVASGLVSSIEPRYKMLIWTIQLAIAFKLLIPLYPRNHKYEKS